MGYLTDFFRNRGFTVTSPYGPRPSLGDFHNGIDFYAPRGTPIPCPWPGVVIKAGYDGSKRGYGHYVGVEMEDKHVQVFAHMDSRNVKVGQRVQEGDIIGPLGMTGFCTGPHLHYQVNIPGGGVRGDNAWGDPEQYIFGGDWMDYGIVIGTYLDYPAAEPLARKLEAPIFIHGALQELHKCHNVIICGGPEEEVKKAAPDAKIENLSGLDRYETYALIAARWRGGK